MMDPQKDLGKKTILTGIKPTDYCHIGNYLGAIRPGIELINQCQTALLFIADYHALTTVTDPQDLKDFTYSLAATWLACGLNPQKAIIYRQSDIPEIFELSWVLSCMTAKGLMNRAHAYKAKVHENQQAGKEDLDDGVSMGLFYYPVLMSADILAFNSDIVPVGEDQIQHVEIARDIAQKFNRTYGDILRLPRHLVKTKKMVPGLDGRKMSKSYGNHIPIFMESEKMRKLVMKIVTDSTPPEVPKDTNNSVLFDLYKEFATPEQVDEMTVLYQRGVGWGEVKQKLFEAMQTHLSGPSKVYNDYMQNPEKLEVILQDGARRAREIATPMMQKIRVAIRGL